MAPSGIDRGSRAGAPGRRGRRRTRCTRRRRRSGPPGPTMAPTPPTVCTWYTLSLPPRTSGGSALAKSSLTRLAAEAADRLHQVVGEQLPAAPRRAAVGARDRAARRSARRPGGTGAARGRRWAGCARCRRARPARSARPTSAPAGRRRCAPCAAGRRATACPPGRCRARRPARSTSAATSSAAIALRACSRSIGIRPIAGNSRRVVHESMYSALPMKNARRGIDCSRATESKNEMWLAATITPPSVGTWSLSSTRTRSEPRYSGVVTALMTRYSRSVSRSAGPASRAPPARHQSFVSPAATSGP